MKLDLVEWAARECTWQQSGEMSVLWMLEGWKYAHRRARWLPTEKNILELGRLVEPRKNQNGYRIVEVRVGCNVKLPSAAIQKAMEDLLDESVMQKMDPDAWFKLYEDIHPFRDGNGRTGSILWNWLRGSLDQPEEPPDFWNYRNQELFDRLVNQ